MKNVLSITMTALMAAVICVLAPISIVIPISAVPISLGTFAVYLSAGLLKERLGSLSVLIYLLIGLVGIPVFAGWRAGASVIAGPTGGYLLGYLIIAYSTGWFVRKYKGRLVYIIVGMVLGTLGCYMIGTTWLGYQLNLSFREALFAGVIPFLPGDTAKIIIAAVIIKPVMKQIDKLLCYN